MPTDFKQRSQLNRWMLFVVTELEQPLWRIARNSFLYPEQQRGPSDIEIAQAEFRSIAAKLRSTWQSSIPWSATESASATSSPRTRSILGQPGRAAR